MPATSSSYAMAMPYSPAQTWSHRVPSPPRIVVPPPALNANGMPDLHVVHGAKFDFESSGFANAEFLKKVTYGNFMTANNMLEWKYEQRRMAQQILPFLYLGPMSAARDKSFLQREGISMVLAVRDTKSAQARLLGTKVADELGLDTKMVDVAGNQELIAAFPRAIELINTHLSTMYHQEQSKAIQKMSSPQDHRNAALGKVLVFCETGNERSATLVTAYIMAMYAVELVNAIQIVQAQRFAVAFDDPMRNLLSTYEIMLQAKRDVVQANIQRADIQRDMMVPGTNAGSINGTGKSSKRSFDIAHEEDMDIDIEDADLSRYDGRNGAAPFQDKSSG